MRVNWNRVLDHPVAVGTVVAFATNQLSGKIAEKIFRLGPDRQASGYMRRMLRERGVMESRRICRKSLRRRNLID